MTAARLKALGVDSVMIDRNAEIGAVWMNRYDSLRIHLPASNCEMPFSSELPYSYDLVLPLYCLCTD
jgi:cation diffusion facilitator CzcD-associated flavoprotein CzcO